MRHIISETLRINIRWGCINIKFRDWMRLGPRTGVISVIKLLVKPVAIQYWYEISGELCMFFTLSPMPVQCVRSVIPSDISFNLCNYFLRVAILNAISSNSFLSRQPNHLQAMLINLETYPTDQPR